MSAAGPCPGLRDKLYWRPVAGGLWHCFKKLQGGGYISLCERHESPRSGGQCIGRPPVHMRCGQCDVAEINRRGKDESLPEAPNWKEHRWA